jgi:hypothetical protein
MTKNNGKNKDDNSPVLKKRISEKDLRPLKRAKLVLLGDSGVGNHHAIKFYNLPLTG